MTDGPPEIREISFGNDFHPLDHRIGSRYCRSFADSEQNGFGVANAQVIRLHWRYLREFKYTWDQRLVHRVLCRFGRHDMHNWWRGNRPGTPATSMGSVCTWCDHKGEFNVSTD
jgi:hypothetical protein